MLSLNEKLSNALTERSLKFTQGQIEYVLNCKHDLLPKGKTFNQTMSASMYMPEMIGTVIDLLNLTKFESDFRYL